MSKVQHFEIPADDLTRARKFYESCFNRQTVDWPMADGSNYVGLMTGPMDEQHMPKEPGFINGGMFQRGSQFPVTGPTVAITVENIDKSLEKVAQSGGAVLMPKITIEGMGLYAYVRDTEGNVVGVRQNLPKKPE